LFHLGSLIRLNELGVLGQTKVIVSVSGGSVLNGVLATRWTNLTRTTEGTFANFDEIIRKPTIQFCQRDLRTRLLFFGRLDPRKWPVQVHDLFAVRANYLAAAYERLFGDRTLAALPNPDDSTPHFVFCATNVRTGASWQFHGGWGARMGDFYTGYTDVGDTRVTQAVAASSAFPPGFGALRLRPLPSSRWTRVDPWGEVRPEPDKGRVRPEESRALLLLTDGGVYDNLGLEPVWDRTKTILLSDAGKPFDSSDRCRQWAVPRLMRAADISAEQVGAVRKRWLVQLMKDKKLQGTLWQIDTKIEDFHDPTARGFGPEARQLFPIVRTDFNAFTDGEVGALLNHGYSLADAAVRTFASDLTRNPGAPFRWPCPDYATDAECEKALANSSSRRVLHDIWSVVRGRS
jgi:NTE family protein